MLNGLSSSECCVRLSSTILLKPRDTEFRVPHPQLKSGGRLHLNDRVSWPISTIVNRLLLVFCVDGQTTRMFPPTSREFPPTSRVWARPPLFLFEKQIIDSFSLRSTRGENKSSKTFNTKRKALSAAQQPKRINLSLATPSSRSDFWSCVLRATLQRHPAHAI